MRLRQGLSISRDRFSRTFNKISEDSVDVAHAINSLVVVLTFDLSSNRFTGMFPRDGLRHMFVAHLFDISRNGFSGTLQSKYDDLLATLIPHLVDISGNDLEGTIPAVPALLSSVQGLFLSRNLFAGADLCAAHTNYSVTRHTYTVHKYVSMTNHIVSSGYAATHMAVCALQVWVWVVLGSVVYSTSYL
eukprot:2974521-Amphidinium_carterae.1